MTDLSFQRAPRSIIASIAGLNTETPVEQNLEHLFTLPGFLCHGRNTDKRGW